MKQINLIIIILLIPLILCAYVFEVNKLNSLIFITSATAVDLSNNYFDRQLIESPTYAEIDALNYNDVPFFDSAGLRSYSQKFKDFSDYAAYITIGSTLFSIYESDKQIFIDNLIVFSEILITQSAIAKWTKTLTHRYRPFVYDDDVSIAKKQQRNSQHSFFQCTLPLLLLLQHLVIIIILKERGVIYILEHYCIGSAVATAALE